MKGRASVRPRKWRRASQRAVAPRYAQERRRRSAGSAYFDFDDLRFRTSADQDMRLIGIDEDKVTGLLQRRLCVASLRGRSAVDEHDRDRVGVTVLLRRFRRQ